MGDAPTPPDELAATKPHFGSVRIRDRGRLPHWELEGGCYAITYRLADSLPQSVLQRFEWERNDLLQRATRDGRKPTASEQKRIDELFSDRIEQYLDQGSGACWMKDLRIAEIVAGSIRHFDSAHYRLIAWCVMPNHVHVVAKLFPNWKLESIVHSWKSFSAKAANTILNRSGAFWAREYYDHLVRDGSDLGHHIGYVLGNPSKAGLDDWKWVEPRGQDARATAGETPALR